MRLVPRSNTPTDNTRRLYIIAATGIVAALAIVSMVFTSIFYAKYHDDIIFIALNKIKPLLIVALTFEALLVVVFIIELVISILLPIDASEGWYVLTMMVITQAFILCIFICYAIFCSEGAKNKDSFVSPTEQGIIFPAIKNLSILTLICWSIAIIIFVWVSFIYAKIYQCE